MINIICKCVLNCSIYLLNITDDSNVSKEENEKIPLEVLEYLENIEQENQSLKKPLVYVEKLMDYYDKLKSESENLKVKNQELEDARLCKICMEAETVSYTHLTLPTILLV